MDQNRSLFISLASVLVGFGVLMVHSASITSWPTEFDRIYLSRHVIILAVGLAAATFCAVLPAKFWQRTAPYLFLACVALLVLVLVPGIGTRVNGAQRWFRYGGLSLQPSEIAKIALPLLVCRIMIDEQMRSRGWLIGTARTVAPIVVVVPLVVVEPDLGTAVFLILGCGIALFVGGWPIRNFVLAAAALVPAAVSLLVLRPYQMRRITGFLAAWNDWEQAPYQLKQSMVSLGAGGVGGVGLGKGWQKLSFLPEANTDFVVAVVGEELGLIGTLALIALWIGFFYAGLRVLAARRDEPFAYAAGMTLLVQLVLQATLNLLVVTGLVPPKGIPHPLISYGGSNLVITIVSIGIILSLSRTSQLWMDASEVAGGNDQERSSLRRMDSADVLAGPHEAPRWVRQPFQGTGPRDLRELRSEEELDDGDAEVETERGNGEGTPSHE